MAEADWLTDEQQRAWRHYRRMRTLLDLEISRDLRHDSHLSDTDYDVLSTLSESADGSWRARELADRLLWSTSRLAHQVGRMEQRGLVQRFGTDADGRGAIVELTTEGRAVLAAAAPSHVGSVRRNLIDLLTPAEVRALDRIARKVVDHLQTG
ncbi:MAG TPA: MarR family transcriptional regulator [Jatrophihabitans sp.]